MRQFFQIALPVAILVAVGFLTKGIIQNPNKPKTKKVVIPAVYVEVQNAVKKDFPVVIETQGEAAPRISSKIIPEVSGKVISISDNLFAGRFFEKDEILVKIDPRDYEIALAKSKTELVKAKTALEQEKVRTQNFDTAIINGQNMLQKNILTLKEEEARAEQALIDWKRLGREGSPGELVLRKPQLKAAKAAVAAAQADIEKAKRDLSLVDALLDNAKSAVAAAQADVRQKEINLERCTIKAPFKGRVISKSINIGQYTSPGNAIADVYAIDIIEVRLPLAAKDLQFINLPDDVPGERSGPKPEVIFSVDEGQNSVEWQGHLDRTESEMDSKSRQHYVVGQIKNPFSGKHALKPGTFVKAKIIGKTLKDVFIVPISSLRESSYVWLINEQSKLQKKTVKILWRDMHQAILSGLQEGDKICTTTLTFARDGLPVIEKGREAAK